LTALRKRKNEKKMKKKGESEKLMSEMQLRKVILYKTGLGYFEKKGKIDLSKNEKISLSINKTVMNDLLKTFSINSIAGKFSVKGISYESESSNVQKMLEDSLINLPEQDVFVNLLLQLRGMKISAKIGTKDILGTIVGLQSRTEAVSDKNAGVLEVTYLMIKNDNEKVESIKIKEISGLQILDSVAKKDFAFFMDVVKSGKKEKNRNLAIFLQGEKEVEYQLTYIQELPAWKVSYRLFLDQTLPDSDKGTDDDEFTVPILLQGWAIIDNILDEEWKNVKLTLISGLPVSFKYDSYSPLWINRPTVQRNQNLTVDTPTSTSASRSSSRGFVSGSEGVSTPPGVVADGLGTPDSVVKTIVSSNPIKGSGFRYDIKVPVNVKRNQSSLIPIVQAQGQAKLISVFNESAQPVNPLLSLEVCNDFTEFVLEQGPISIFKDNIFEGEAMLPFIELKETQQIPYAIDQGMEIHKKSKNISNNYHGITFGSNISKKYFQEKLTTYSIKNITDNKKILILEHPIESGYTLFDSTEPDSKSSNFLRFKLTVDETSSQELILKEKKLNWETNYYENITKQMLDDWIKLDLIESDLIEFFKKMLDVKFEISKIQTKISELQNIQSDFSQEHSRIRENLDVLGEYSSDKELKQRYISKLMAQENEIDEIEKQIKEYRATVKKLTNDLNKLAKDLRNRKA
jgi:hypothetical protein